MPQQASKENTAGSTPLTQEQARAIATKSHERLKAQRSPTKPPPPNDQERMRAESVKQRLALRPPPLPEAFTIGSHLTKEGKPDRRFIENQHLTDQEAEIEKAKIVLRQAGIAFKE